MGGSTGDATRKPMNSRIPAPLHTIALGDTSLQKDIRILRLLHNDVAGLGNRFPIEIELGAQGYQGPSEVRIDRPRGQPLSRSQFRWLRRPRDRSVSHRGGADPAYSAIASVSAQPKTKKTPPTTNGRPSSTSLKAGNASCWPGPPPTPIKAHGPMHSRQHQLRGGGARPLMTSTPMTQKGAGMQPFLFRSMQGTRTAVESVFSR